MRNLDKNCQPFQELRKRNSLEIKLWERLRNRRFYGFKFKNRWSLGIIYDFSCNEKKIIVELDGGQHSEPEIKTKDENKQQYAIGQGYKVLRFQNIDVDKI